MLADKSAIENVIMSNQQLADEIQKPMIGKFDKRKVYSSIEDNIWGADLEDTQLISN